jgi:hypothetical protein
MNPHRAGYRREWHLAAMGSRFAEPPSPISTSIFAIDSLQHQLVYPAMHDPLTGLPNRIVLAERLEWALGRGGSDSQAVMLIDLDGFKDVNHTFGHPTGDDVLVNVSRRLVTAAPENGVVARLAATSSPSWSRRCPTSGRHSLRPNGSSMRSDDHLSSNDSKCFCPSASGC